MTFAALMESLTEDQQARLFRHFPPETLRDSMRARGLDVDCTDPGTLAAAARIHVRYLRERERDRADHAAA